MCFRPEATSTAFPAHIAILVLGVVALANTIPNMGAISSANLLQNAIGIDQVKALASILKEHPTLKSLCGNKGDETELDMSGKMRGAEDAIMLAAEIIDNGALTSLNISNNRIGQGLKAGENPEFDHNWETDVAGTALDMWPYLPVF
jgi:hypothetical protein